MIDRQTGQLKFRVVQSPMAGCSDLAFRLISRRYGMQYCFLEMISANGLIHDSRQSHELLKTVPEDRPVGAQLVGCEPDVMAEAARRVIALGFEHLDLNLGCPVRKVTSQGAGAALMDDRIRAEKVFSAVVKAVAPVPVTVKMRKGFKDDSGRQAVDIAKAAEDNGIVAVTVHGRTQAQGYVGPADWRAIGMVKRAVSIPVLGNGDVIDVESARRMRDETGCDGMMIGRGGLGNPWLFAAIRSALFSDGAHRVPTREEKLQAALEHMEFEARYEGVDRAVFHMRRIGTWYIQGVPHAAGWRARLNQSRTLDHIRSVLTPAILETGEPAHVVF